MWKANSNRYVLIDLHSGIMDGCYSDLKIAQSAREDLNQTYEGANFCVFEGLSDPGDFRGTFPPDHLFHANVRVKLKGETIQ